MSRDANRWQAVFERKPEAEGGSMKRIAVVALAAVLSAFGAIAIAQEQRSPTDQSTSPQSQPSQPGMMGCGMTGGGMTGGGMMGGGMTGGGTMGGGKMPGGKMNGGMMGMGMMGQMRAHHQQMMDLMNKLMESMTAIEAAKDQATLKAKLAEHRALLEQMHGQMTQQGCMMQQMQQMQMPANSGNTPPPASK
jgi:uncharacterized membrane protein